jgi:hypothetical protein
MANDLGYGLKQRVAGKQKYVRRGLRGSVSDARAMGMREVRAWMTLLWDMGGFWPRLLISAIFGAVATLIAVSVMIWGPLGWLRVMTLAGLAIVLTCWFVYMVTAPRDPWDDIW